MRTDVETLAIADHDGEPQFRSSVLLAGLCLAGLMVPLELTMVAVALPVVEVDLGLSPAGGAWVIDAYMVAFAGFVLAAGAIADHFGRGRSLVAGIALFGAASAVCGVVTTAGLLWFARAVQGFGAALTISSALGVLADRFRGQVARFRAFGAFTTAIGVGMASGPSLGGALAAAFGWRATFYVHAPIALIAACLVTLAGMPASGRRMERTFDASGVVLATLALVSLVGALIEGASIPMAWTTGLVAGGMVFCGLFVWVECSSPDPVFDLTLLRNPAFAGAQLAAVAYSSAFGAQLVFLPRAFETGGAGVLAAGLAMLPLTAPALIVPQLAARYAAKLSPRAWLAGGLIVACGGSLALAGLLTAGPPQAMMPGAMLLTGIGFAATNAHLTNIAMASVPLARAGVASGLNFTVRQAGVALGVAAAERIFALRFAMSAGPASSPKQVALICTAAGLMAALGAVLAWQLGPRAWGEDGHSPPAPTFRSGITASPGQESQ